MELEAFIEGTCKLFGIDESHGLKHSRSTVKYAELLIKTANISESQKEMALMAAAIHDMCDSKYTDVSTSSKRIHNWLVNTMKWPEDMANSLVWIITSMSYSKLKRYTHSKNSFVPLLPSHGIWQTSYEIARHADLLDSYNVSRCVLYNRHLFPEKTEDEHWARAKELFDERVFNYIKDGWITIPEAKRLAADLEVEARRCLEQRCMDW
jgi:hypothetical protein